MVKGFNIRFNIRFNIQSLSEKKKENLITALYIGAIFILLAVIYLVNLPMSLWDRVLDLFRSFTLSTVPGSTIQLPAPFNPSAHIPLYVAVFQFCLGLGVIEIGVLTLRILLHSPTPRKAETLSNLIFWLLASYLSIAYLVNMSIMTEWFVFWAGIILVGGISLVARALIIMLEK